MFLKDWWTLMNKKDGFSDSTRPKQIDTESIIIYLPLTTATKQSLGQEHTLQRLNC